MNYGFVIDNRKCIGCHACSTACKSENEVPLGVYRTWVKYVETGAYPNTRRHFQVTRCNHCANPPCVRICPVTAMYQRADGIVEFDPRVCIGCKACMQACPYDAIYIDPETHTAAKCHYCSHRVELGLEPACVVVCPEHAIIAGDMDDPNSEISRILATQKVTVRKPEQGTAPKLFYIEGNDWALHPTATERAPETFMWADVIPLHAKPHANGHANGAGNGHAVSVEVAANVALYPATTKTAKSGVAIREPQPQGDPVGGPIHIGRGRMAEHMVQVAYNAQHKIPWHWPVPAYLVTKGVGAGVFMLLTLAFGLGLSAFDGVTAAVGGFVSLLFIAATTGLLVYDLERPERFLSIVFRPQWKSWLTRGAFILIGFSTIAGLWWLLETGTLLNLLPTGLSAALRQPLLWIGGALAVGAAVYTAFLFGQAEGRDLWQSPLLPFHLVVQALMVGAGTLLALDLFLAMPEAFTQFTRVVFVVALLVDLFVTLVGEFSMPHATELAARAAHEISHGRYRRHFWQGGVLLGHAAPLALMALAFLIAPIAPLLAAIAGVCAIVGLYFFEYAFVMAPQELPNS
ncbi:4Fe-4S dicluster domain-containing protein [Caldilinea sp.]|jgi:Fe-S-cluster-containing dehydrogenase component/formate-dependent nitrite reductase membrane component NrfD|uniref:4Fe-4S dicluster domain-containing protein n=1 Tax=Caldilinea sp. TaxID=2293560 RepID=UPI00262FDCE1|nr:4Fe-4S dicluster domain-containing protein [uncultured Caldilinea sp.]